MNKSGLLLMSMLSLAGCAGQEVLDLDDVANSSSQGLTAPARAPRMISLLVQAEQAGQGVTVTPGRAQVGTFALTPSLTNEEGENWRAEALDAHGRVVHEVRVRSHLEFHLETFDPDTGAIAEARTVDAPRDVFEVSLPFDARVASIHIALEGGRASRRAASRPATAIFSREALEQLTQRSEQARMATSATKTTLLNNGPSSSQMDYVFVGEGYTAAEMDKWRADAQKVVDGFMADPLFAANRGIMNVHRVDVASAQSGADEPDLGISRDTAMGAAFNCNNTARLLCVDTTKVRNIVGSVLAADARDVIVVVVNSTRYGGAGGSVATLSMATQSIEIALHEIGHTAFALADEYESGTCNLGSEPSEGNVSKNGTRTVKWKNFIAASTPVPTAPGQFANGTVGAFKGGHYCATGKFRPTEDSRMRTLGMPWHAVNTDIARQVFARYRAASSLSPETVPGQPE